MGKKTTSKLGDVRLEKSFTALIGAMVVKYTTTIRQLGNTRAEQVQFGRFINNPKITPKALVNQWHDDKAQDLGGKDLLILSDTSTISFPKRLDRKGLGFVGVVGSKSGFDVHPAIVLNAQNGACYGLGGISTYRTSFYKTEEEQTAKKQRRKDNRKIPFEQKERFKWFDAPRQAISNYPKANSYTLIGDRESDIYELMGLTLKNGWSFLYRSRANRVLTSPQGRTSLYEEIESWSVKDVYQLKLGKTQKRTAHEAKMELKYGTITLNQTENRTNKTIPSKIRLQVVQVKEQLQTVVGDEKPVNWILLTSHPVENIEQAMQIVQWYLWRWSIEQLFRTLKLKGLNVESSEVENYEALLNLTTLALLAAVQVLQLVQARDNHTLQQIEDAFSQPEIHCLQLLNKKLEGKTQKQKNPFPPKSLAFATWVIARLGGWKGYKKSRPPGPVTLIKGLTKFYNILEGYLLFS